jgi:hypothetical protein
VQDIQVQDKLVQDMQGMLGDNPSTCGILFHVLLRVPRIRVPRILVQGQDS